MFVNLLLGRFGGRLDSLRLLGLLRLLLLFIPNFLLLFSVLDGFLFSFLLLCLLLLRVEWFDEPVKPILFMLLFLLLVCPLVLSFSCGILVDSFTSRIKWSEPFFYPLILFIPVPVEVIYCWTYGLS